MLISDLQIADKHHNFAKFEKQKDEEMSDADMASRASCCVSYCLSPCQLHRHSQPCAAALVPGANGSRAPPMWEGLAELWRSTAAANCATR